jgi:hypothetical protein
LKFLKPLVNATGGFVVLENAWGRQLAGPVAPFEANAASSYLPFFAGAFFLAGARFLAGAFFAALLADFFAGDFLAAFLAGRFLTAMLTSGVEKIRGAGMAAGYYNIAHFRFRAIAAGYRSRCRTPDCTLAAAPRAP